MILPSKKTTRATDFSKTKTLITGLPKTGKSTFLSKIDGMLIAAFEDGLNYLETSSVKVASWEFFLQLCSEFISEKHEYKMLGIDIADIAYQSCEDYICKKEVLKNIAEPPFGGGYKLAKREFLRVLNKVNLAGYGIILTSHAKIKEIKKKTTTYTMIDSSLPGSMNEAVCGFVDHIFYFYIDEDGSRLMRTKPTKYINAGDRSGKLPETMPIDYDQFIKTYNEKMSD